MQGDGEFSDKTAMRLIELLLDVHHFKDSIPAIENEALGTMFAEIRQIIADDMAEVAEEDVVKVLASVYRSIQRRTNGGNAYLSFIRNYVGPRIVSGVRVITKGKLQA